MKEMEVSLGIAPSVGLRMKIEENASLETINEDELTNLQLMVVNGLRKTSLIEPSLQEYEMTFSTLKIELGPPPVVRVCLQWKQPTDSEEYEDGTLVYDDR